MILACGERIVYRGSIPTPFPIFLKLSSKFFVPYFIPSNWGHDLERTLWLFIFGITSKHHVCGETKANTTC
jgi:hypothetical protein